MAPLDQASAAQYTPQGVRSSNISASATPTSEYGLNPSSARSTGFPEHISRQPQYQYAPQQHPSASTMAQATSPSMNSLQDGAQPDHRNPPNMKSDNDVPIDPSIAQSSPTYPPPYSPYQPQGHDMAHYQGQPPPQLYARPDGAWPQQYPGHHMPGPYSSPAVPTGSPAATAGPRPGQVSRELCCVVLLLSSFLSCAHSSAREITFHLISSLTPCPRSTLLYPSPARSSTSARVVATRKSRGCTSAGGMGARRRMGLLIISTRT